MHSKLLVVTVMGMAMVAIQGCGPSQPEHIVKPLTARPVAQNGFKNASTPEEKIRFIENSGAPDNVKKSAIERVKAGQL